MALIAALGLVALGAWVATLWSVVHLERTQRRPALVPVRRRGVPVGEH
jgi:hypothetical protein